MTASMRLKQAPKKDRVYHHDRFLCHAYFYDSDESLVEELY